MRSITETDCGQVMYRGKITIERRGIAEKDYDNAGYGKKCQL